MLDNCTPLHFYDAGTVNVHRYSDEVLEAYVSSFWGAVVLASCLLTIIQNHTVFTILMVS